jgi:hypothetical protein
MATFLPYDPLNIPTEYKNEDLRVQLLAQSARFAILYTCNRQLDGLLLTKLYKIVVPSGLL